MSAEMIRFPADVRAVLFDLDGTLMQNVALHHAAWAQFGREFLGQELDPGDERLHAGTTLEVMDNLLGRRLSRSEALQWRERKESTYRRLANGQLQPLAGLLAYLAALQARGLPLALVTNACSENTQFSLRQLGVTEYFALTVDADLGLPGKPAPDAFLYAAQHLGVAAQQCLVHEDSPAGIRAAVAAGCQIAAMTTSLSAERARQLGAHWAMADYQDPFSV